ncbi:MAG: BMC domain-containing protein [Methylacidiphilales bacterium]|nr:BMC domain-containing protein [Candidatus Methylacidiphilales bacterium]
MSELRSFICIDKLQPQTMSYMATWISGSLPRMNVAAQIIEIAPGQDIEYITDIALKYGRVQAGILIVERQFGYLEFHSESIAEVRAAAQAVLDTLNLDINSVIKPQIFGSKIITNIDEQHAYLINRNRKGSLLLKGESVFLMEVQPASYAILACNEAEKQAQVKVIDYRMIGANGRVYLAGTEAEMQNARQAAENALAQIAKGINS